ncbi:FHA domain-containing protein [Luteibacter aegosomatis]|uniref:FHA domain-containing protein n=1 Tax=Luteibacter aegosomatis TaxID=2911537 RepID=UPI001FFAF1AB|nr:FHA domain-containing protein [Luteibacter aegosomatis]UPG84771.1 FHA domain-containing protein [Luteibacter aegosomatis]
MTIWLHPEGHPDEAVRVDGAGFAIGRAGDSDWRLAGAGVSRRHVVIRRLNGMYLVEDVSRNGTRLNGRVLARGEPIPLAAGDRLAIDGLDILVVDRPPDAFASPSQSPVDGVGDPLDGLPDAIPGMPGADPARSWEPPPVEPRDTLSLARGLFDALLDDLDPARFEREGGPRAGRKNRHAAWGRYHRHFRRIQVDPEAYFRRLIDEDMSPRTLG